MDGDERALRMASMVGQAVVYRGTGEPGLIGRTGRVVAVAWNAGQLTVRFDEAGGGRTVAQVATEELDFPDGVAPPLP